MSFLSQLLHAIRVICMQLTRELQGQLNTYSFFLFTVDFFPHHTKHTDLSTCIRDIINYIGILASKNKHPSLPYPTNGYFSVYTQVNLHLKSFSHLCAVQGYLWKRIAELYV